MWMLLVSCVLTACVAQARHLPDTRGIPGELTERLGVDQFFSLWLVFHNDEIRTSGDDYTILAPQNNTLPDHVLARPDLVRQLVLSHILLGQRLHLEELSDGFTFTTLSGRNVTIHNNNGSVYANEAQVLTSGVELPEHGMLAVLDSYLFPDELEDLPPLKPDAEIQAAESTTVSEPESDPKAALHDEVDILEDTGTHVLDESDQLTFLSQSEPHLSLAKTDNETAYLEGPGHDHNSSFLENVGQVFTYMRSGVLTFHQFLQKSNVSEYLKPGEEYTVFVPTDQAFQRWHPIDWGFYPFSVDEFTNSVIINHFIQGNIKQDAIKDGQRAKTLGGREVIFHKKPLSIDAVPIIKGDTPVAHGNIMFVTQVLFVTDKVVQRLNQQHRDKETPPLLAYPWYQSQFLSHAYLNLEKRPEFSHITHFINVTDLAPYVRGAGYTFFVPTNKAIEKISLHKVSGSERIGEILLDHFVKRPLYSRDLKDEIELHTLGNKTIHMRRENGEIRVNNATVEGKEEFVYNLGTMFFIDQVLFVDESFVEYLQENLTEESIMVPDINTPSSVTSHPEVEGVPTELVIEHDGSQPDILLEEPASNDTVAEPEDAATEDSEIAGIDEVPEVDSEDFPKANIGTTAMVENEVTEELSTPDTADTELPITTADTAPTTISV